MSLDNKEMTQNSYGNDRPGERALSFDPRQTADDARLIFIGRVAAPWQSREDCPKNMTAARETGKPARILIDPPYRAGLGGLAGHSHIIVLTWLHGARRDLIIQKPHHAPEPRGTFALRSPVRPNPIGLHVVRLLALDMESGTLSLEAIDVLDGTPVLDIKPYFASTDGVPDATRPDRTGA